VPAEVVTPTSGLYTTIWKRLPRQPLPDGMPIMAGGLYWPTQGFPLDTDVRDYFGFDETQRLVDVNLLFEPMFQPKILREDSQYIVYTDVDNVQRKFIKEDRHHALGGRFAHQGPAELGEAKRRTAQPQEPPGPVPRRLERAGQEYKNRTYPLALGGYPHGSSARRCT